MRCFENIRKLSGIYGTDVGLLRRTEFYHTKATNSAQYFVLVMRCFWEQVCRTWVYSSVAQ